MTTIFHGTPLTPRAALNSIMPGRAACVSFYRPDDLEALLAICPQLMFRPRGVQLLDGRPACREGMGRGRARGVAPILLPMAGTDDLSSRPLGDHGGQSGRPVPAQRWAAERVAVRSIARCSGLAHGRLDRSPCAPVRAISARLCRMDWRPEKGACRLSGLPSQDGRGGGSYGQCLAPAAHAARDCGRLRLSLHQRGQHQLGPERAPIFDRHEATGHLGRPAYRPVGRASSVCGQTGGQAS